MTWNVLSDNCLQLAFKGNVDKNVILRTLIVCDELSISIYNTVLYYIKLRLQVALPVHVQFADAVLLHDSILKNCCTVLYSPVPPN